MLDRDPSIIKWASEEFSIPYIHPMDNQVHQYFPDFYVECKVDGGSKYYIIEVKPHKQTYLKENASKKTRILYAVNQAKWKAAMAFCEAKGFTFKILTEKKTNVAK